MVFWRSSSNLAPLLRSQPGAAPYRNDTYMVDHLLTPIQRSVMELLVKPRTGKAVAEMYRDEHGRKIPSGTLYTVIRRLRYRGLVETVGYLPTGDRRYRVFQLTGAGREALSWGESFGTPGVVVPAT